ncbi:MAG: hypothetical protein PCFJNLEI_03302 [Verrucomicrobiae bacterium]|nr:hypothetical protein [Verrucomicrobiae bacterium]
MTPGRILFAALLGLSLLRSVLADDVVTLNSGEAITGHITSETGAQVVIDVPNASRTIFTPRTISKSEIKTVQRETAEAKQERLAYEALQKYRLNPDQEWTVAQYNAALAVCQQFLGLYPDGEHAAAVRQKNEQCQKEKEQVEKGLVKFDNRWMSASQKAAERELRTNFDKLEQMERSVAYLGRQRASPDKISRAKSDLARVQRDYDNAKAKRDQIVASAVQAQKTALAQKAVLAAKAAVPAPLPVVQPAPPPVVQPAPAPKPAAVVPHPTNAERQRQLHEARIQAEMNRVRETQARQLLQQKQNTARGPGWPYWGLVVVVLLVGGAVALVMISSGQLSPARGAIPPYIPTPKRANVSPRSASPPPLTGESWRFEEVRQQEPSNPDMCEPRSVIEKLRRIDWYKFEKVVGLIYQSQGYRVKLRGGAKADGGIDLEVQKDGDKVAVQCKHWKTYKVRLRVVKELFASMTDEHFSRGMIVVLDKFTSEAKAYAIQHTIDFVTAADLERMIAQLDSIDQHRIHAMLDDPTVNCPKCDSVMNWKAPPHGKVWKRKPFWGCTRFPSCDGKIEV